jgi:hypothetical protein
MEVDFGPIDWISLLINLPILGNAASRHFRKQSNRWRVARCMIYYGEELSYALGMSP